MTLIIEISLATLILVAVCVTIWIVFKVWKKQVELAAELIDVRNTIIALYEAQKIFDKRWRSDE